MRGRKEVEPRLWFAETPTGTAFRFISWYSPPLGYFRLLASLSLALFTALTKTWVSQLIETGLLLSLTIEKERKGWTRQSKREQERERKRERKRERSHGLPRTVWSSIMYYPNSQQLQAHKSQSETVTLIHYSCVWSNLFTKCKYTTSVNICTSKYLYRVRVYFQQPEIIPKSSITIANTYSTGK